jgi:SepF-like predicted cell division protein (DUF552 family)
LYRKSNSFGEFNV